MDYLNDLYKLGTPRVSLTGEKCIKINNGFISISDNMVSMCVNKYQKNMIVEGYTIHNGCSSESSIYLICEVHGEAKFKNFILKYNGANDTYISYGLISDHMFDTVNSMIVVNDILYVVNNEGEMYCIDTTNTKTPLLSNLMLYPSGTKCVASLLDKALFGTDKISKTLLFYDSSIYAFEKKDTKYISYNIKTKIIKRGALDCDFVIKDVEEAIQIGEKNDFSEKGAVTVLSTGKQLCLFDMIDLSGSLLEEFETNISILKFEDEIFVSEKELYKVNPKTLEFEKPYTSDDFSNSILLNKNGELYVSNHEESRKLEKVDEACIVNITCINNNGTYIKNYNEILPKGGKVIITAINIDGYSHMQYSTKEIDSSQDLVYVNFFYQYTADVLSVQVEHICEDFILSSYEYKGRVGQKYNIKPLEIPGYIYETSEHNEGVFGPNMLKCIIRYKTEADFSTNNSNKTYVCVNCICEGLKTIQKFISTNKGKNISISAPTINCYSPDNKVINIEEVSSDITEISLNYSKVSDGILTEYYYLNNLLYEDVSPIKGIIAEIQPPSYFKPDKNQYDISNMTMLKVSGNLEKQVSNLKLIDIDKSKELYSIVEQGNKDITSNPEMPKYNYININVDIVSKLKIIKVGYNQSMFNIKIQHEYKGQIIKEDEFFGKKDEFISVAPLDNENLEPIDSLNYKFGPTDKVIIIKYIPKKVQIKTIIYDYITNKILNSNLYIFSNDEEKQINVEINKEYDILYKDTEINKNVIVNNTENSILEYVVANRKSLSCDIKYIDGGIKFKQKNPNKLLISNIKTNDTYLSHKNVKVYLVKDIDKNNSDTKSYLENANVDYIEINKNMIDTIEPHSILIDGNIINKTTFIEEYNRLDVVYIPMDKTYLDIAKTIELAKRMVNDIVDDSIQTIQVENKVFIENIKYNKNNKRLYVDINYIPKDSNIKEYVLELYSINDNKLVESRNINVNTIHNFDRAVFEFNNSGISEPDISNITDIDNLSYWNVLNKEIIETNLHCYLMDKLGNRTSTIHEAISFHIVAENTDNFYKQDIYNNSLNYHNHRYQGPKESYKYINTYAGIERECRNIEKFIESFKLNIKYKNKPELMEGVKNDNRK